MGKPASAPFADVVERAEDILSRVLSGQFSCGVLYDLDERSVPGPRVVTYLYKWNEITLVGNDHDGTLTTLLANWIQALPYVNGRKGFLFTTCKTSATGETSLTVVSGHLHPDGDNRDWIDIPKALR